MDDRVAIRAAIESGRIDEAVAILNHLDPKVQ